MTDEEMIAEKAAEKAATEMHTMVYLEPVPMYRRRGPRVDIVGATGNLRIVLQPGYNAGDEKPKMARHHSTIMSIFHSRHPDLDFAVWSDEGTNPLAAAAVASALMTWLKSADAKAALTESWEIALSVGGE
jgi:hypothetical protein